MDVARRRMHRKKGIKEGPKVREFSSKADSAENTFYKHAAPFVYGFVKH